MKEILAKLDVLQGLAQQEETKQLCEVIRDLVNKIQTDDKKLGFTAEKNK